MKRYSAWPWHIHACWLVLAVTTLVPAWADGRAGTVTWSDGRKMEGALSLPAGKDLRLFVGDRPVTLRFDEVKEMRFKPEKEEMAEGFYFPNVGQATQAKTGEIFPVRHILADITLVNGSVLEGHLFTTAIYVETDQATEKVVLLAKQTGVDHQKLSDMPYPTQIQFDASANEAGSCRIDLTSSGLTLTQDSPLAWTLPELGPLPLQQTEGKPIWMVPAEDPQRILFVVQAIDGIHVAWPQGDIDPAVRKSVETTVNTMQDFYDTRTLLACLTEGDDVDALVLMKRVGETYSFTSDHKAWSLAAFRWKVDPTSKTPTLLNRVVLVTGRLEGNSQPPPVLIDPAFLKTITAISPPTGVHP